MIDRDWMTEPLFTEMQAVLWTGDKGAVAPTEAIVLYRRWEESGNTEGTQYPPEPRWLYKIQMGEDRELFEIWVAETHLIPCGRNTR